MEALELECEPASDAVHGDRTPQPSPEQTKEKEQEKASVSFFGLFVAADQMDYVLMFFGRAGACIYGAALPVFFVLLSWMIDSLRKLSSDPHGLSSRVSEDALHLVHLGLILFASAWIGVALWTLTGERTARLRLEGLQAVRRKDINFFDSEA